MTATDSNLRMRTLLRWDAAACLAFGVAMTAGAVIVERLLALPVVWSVAFGVYLFACAAVMLLIAARPTVRRGQAIGVVVNNVIAAAAMLALPFTGLVELTGLGIAVMVAGAGLVLAFAILEELGLRRLAPA